MIFGFAIDSYWSSAKAQATNLRERDKIRSVYVNGENAGPGETVTISFVHAKMAARPDAEKVLAIDGSLAMFGRSEKEIAEVRDAFLSAGVVIWDKANDERSDRDGLKMWGRAINDNRYRASMGGNRREAKKRGKRGGQAKGEAAARRRKGRCDDDIVEAIVMHPKLSLRDKSGILGKEFSVPIIQRLMIEISGKRKPRRS